VDREHWHGTFTDMQRRAALWNYSLFFHGEDAVADNLSPYIDAAPREEQKYFLATQQVDEARHAIFFARFMREVVEQGTDIASSLEATRPQLTWGFRKVFERLDVMADELRRDRSIPKLAQGIALYHIVIEGTLAQPGQHFIESYLTDQDLLPGFREGMRNVSLDEQRHIGFGVKLLRDLVNEDPECKDAVAELLREVMPYTISLFTPPGWDESYVECFGFTMEEISAEGIISFESKLRAAGLPLEDMPGVMPLPLEMTPAERAHRSLTLARGNLLGERLGPASRDPEHARLLFDVLERSIDPANLPAKPRTIQWDFRDFEPWYLSLDNGSTHVGQGRAPHADLTLRSSWEDWVDVVAGRQDPRRLMVTGRLRPKGNPRMLWEMRRLFGA